MVAKGTPPWTPRCSKPRSRCISRKCGNGSIRPPAIAKAAETCADVGNIEKAVEIALDVEQLIYEVNTLLNAASLMNRIYQT